MSGWLLTDAVKHTKQHSLAVSQIQRFNDLATRAGCPQVEAPLTLATTLADEQAADAVWQQLGLPHGDRVVVINGGSAQGSARSWPVAHFAALAGRIAEEWGLSVLVNCGPAEREAARSIVHLAQSPLVTSLADFELPIGLSKAVIRRSRLLVTTDSGPRFFAVAFARPVVSLFGATPPAMTATGSPLETSLALGLDCQPCLKRVCPLGHQRCMTDLTVERVFAAVRRVVEGLPKVAVA
jgi:heptosyltransferase-2